MTTYKEIFEKNSEEKLVNAVKNGLYVYHRFYSDKYTYETFFEAAVRHGTPATVNACIDMGADVNCIDPLKALNTSPRAITSSLVAAINGRNLGTLRALIERGARTGVLNGLFWDLKRNLLPEAVNNEKAKKIKQRLDTGAEILKILRDAGFNVPGMNRDDNEMSYHYVAFSSTRGAGKDEDEKIKKAVIAKKYVAWEDWEEKYADGGDDDEEKFDRYCEGVMEWMGEYSFPSLGTRPGALWHAASPEALRLMIEAGADVNATDAAGWTTMHHIAYHCDGDDDDYYFNPDAML